nr:laccase/diphenol oxidase family protein [Tanacetum cinerariifolium]
MPSSNRMLLLFIFALAKFIQCGALQRHFKFSVEEASFNRLCETKTILTVNGQFPGPTLNVREEDTIWVKVHNNGRYNITLHWHGVKQPRNPWSDGPEYITQCPIQPGDSFNYKLILSMEVGTIWWHAHSDWTRATVHGAIIVHPKKAADLPFAPPDQEVPIIFSEGWREDVMEVFQEFVTSGGAPRESDAYTINGQPGDLYPCSSQGTFKLNVTYGKRYLLRMVNAVMNEILFFKIADHSLTVVANDGSYTKPLTTDYVVIAPSQTMDCLLEAKQVGGGRYYMATRAYQTGRIGFDNTTATAVIQYDGGSNSSTTPLFPLLPDYNNTTVAYEFLGSLKGSEPHLFPINKYDTHIISTVSLNTIPCQNNSCAGPNGTRLAGTICPAFLLTPKRATIVRVIQYDLAIELVFQGTRMVAGLDHPMHLHGYSFYIVGCGFGNFDENRDPLNYNLVDPPIRNTVMVPVGGWAAIRFKAVNPGVWFLHCHLERHHTWVMDTAFIVKDGNETKERMLPPPRCWVKPGQTHSTR